MANDLLFYIENIFSFLPLFYFVLAAILLAVLIKFKTIKFIKSAAFFVLVLEILKSTFFTLGTYFLWQNSPVSRFLLPPHKDINYFLKYCGYRFFLPFFISLLAAILIYKLINFLNKKRERKFFCACELWQIFFSVLILSHPFWIFYVFAVLAAGIIIYLIKKAAQPKILDIFSLKYLWLPIALAFLIFNHFILKINFISSLKF